MRSRDERPFVPLPAAAALAAAAFLALLVPGAVGAPGTRGLSLTLRLDGGAAPLVAGKRVGSYGGAVRLAGRPASLVPVPGATPVCRASWPALALVIDFSTAAPGSCAARNLGSWARVTAAGRRWHTTAGLRVGDAERRVHALYPSARQLDFLGLGHLWEVETGGPLCDGGPPLSLGASVSAGRVTALIAVHVPACG